MESGAKPAYAHGSLPGIDGFYAGLLHPFSTPSQAVLMPGLGLVVGSFAVPKVNWHLAAFLAAMLAGMLSGSRFAQLDAALFAVAFAVCALNALQPGKLLAVSIPLVAVAGVLIGMASIPVQDRRQAACVMLPWYSSTDVRRHFHGLRAAEVQRRPEKPMNRHSARVGHSRQATDTAC
ncbi:HupE/UreJ family protein [Sulfitobacter sp. LCG007]